MRKYLQKKYLKKVLLVGLALTTVNVPANVVQASAGTPEGVSANIKHGSKEKTNFVYIVMDDMGFSDFGAYGSEIKTPNIDKLAAEGLVYNNFNVCPLCSPTRASLLTGRDNNAVGMGHIASVDLGLEHPNFRGRVTEQAATVAEILQSNGYSTMAVGKWHLAPNAEISPAGPMDSWPLGRGFDRFYGFLSGETDEYNPLLVYDNHAITPPKENYYFEADVARMAKEFLTDQVSAYPDKPFFLYTAFRAVHSPLQAPKEYIDMYNGVYDQGYDKIREVRFERQKQLGIMPADAKLTHDPRIQPWDSLSTDEKAVSARYMQIYAGYLTYTDEQIGKIVDHLEALGQYDNTMIVLISDNGATDFAGNEGTDFSLKAYTPIKTPIADVKKHINELGNADYGVAYPRGWANVSGTPFENYKGSLFAGGVRAPLIVHWPNAIAAGKDHVRSQYVHVTDITPTVLDIANLKAPETFKGIPQLPMDGTSIVSTFDRADAPSPDKEKYALHVNQRSMYKDGWKAVSIHKKGTFFEEDQWKLYHVAEDLSESTDVAAQYPEKLKELKDAWKIEADRHGTALTEVSIGLESFGTRKEKVFKYYPGTGTIFHLAGPNTLDKSFTITVPVTRNKKAEEGVLFSTGSYNWGYTLFVKDNKLKFEYNSFGQISRMEAPMPLGKAEVQFKMEKTGPMAGIGHLFINGKQVSETKIPYRFFLNSETYDVGRDRYDAVSKEYKKKGEFPFSGQFDYVMVEIED
ncbi:hypothetical protein P22_2118 [Propionispora sp. 2/2-37]|uniref:arylsulfatase n=1 Tax=Propionispora sp. 2/2-37 TaxID=1677858 RepID=UPI0006BB5831|nr:arylsulfatase [Propionispora sp. 2/2-37]CUH96030.1 hypothetical protein P22_2118 [Propionispora sp. 2/2-37]